MNKFTITALGFIVFLCSCNNNENRVIKTIDSKSHWVDSVYNQLSIQEKVGQLFMVATYSNRDSSHRDSILKLIKKHHIGGLIFFQGGPVREAVLTNSYQSISKVPLMIAMDAEWGVNMRLDSTVGFPYNMTLGAIQNNELIQRIGKQIGKHNKRLGIHINFAPVVDINTNPNNPVIGVRSFGEDKLNVTNKASAFMEGMRSEGILSCAKHFPGHGDTESDSHITLPTVSFSAERIDSVELYPYKQLFNKGLASVMVAHLNVPSLESSKDLPSSLSYHIVTTILKDHLSFKGLILTDALNMKGVANFMEPGTVDLEAFKAGNDVLLFSENSPKAISKIIEAYNLNEITEERLSHSVKKFLGAKFDVNLHQFKPIEISQLINDLNKEENSILYEDAMSNAITVIKNDDHSLPLEINSKGKTAYVKLGDGRSETFFASLQASMNIDEISGVPLKKLLKKLKEYDNVIIGYHRSNARRTHSISDEDTQLIEEIAKTSKVILDVFASQYSLKKISFLNIETVIVSYENSALSQKISAKIILGKMAAIGKLPASINKEFTFNHGITTTLQ